MLVNRLLIFLALLLFTPAAPSPAYAPVETAPSAPPQLLLPGQDVQMVMLSTTGARSITAVGDGGKGATGKGGGGESGNHDVEIGRYEDSGYGNGTEGEGGYDGYAVVAVAVAVEDSNSSMLGASAPPLVPAITK
jgi:hypothetical protein